MNNGFAGRCVRHFATRAHVGLLMIATQKKKPTTVWQWVRQKLTTCRLNPNARTNARAAAKHAGTTGVQLHQAVHESIQYMNYVLCASDAFNNRLYN
jgi:hypothetical protein